MFIGVAKLAFLAALLATASVAAAHDSEPLSAQTCDNIIGYGDAGIRSCYALLADQADDKMQRLYDRVLGTVAADDRKRLVQAQRSWIAYRDQYCAAGRNLSGGGTKGLMTLAQCTLNVTQNHIEELRAVYGYRLSPEAETENDDGPTTADAIDAVIAKLDLNSFPNSTGPRRQAGKHSFADYGFTEVEKRSDGATLTSTGGGWVMAFRILSASQKAIKLCLVDQGRMRPGDVRAPSYDARSALIVTRASMTPGEGVYWTAWEVRGGFANCRNAPPVP